MKLLQRRLQRRKAILLSAYAKILPGIPLEIVECVYGFNDQENFGPTRLLRCKNRFPSSSQDKLMDAQDFWKCFIYSCLAYHPNCFKIGITGQDHEDEMEYIRCLVQENPETIFNSEEIERYYQFTTESPERRFFYVCVRGGVERASRLDIWAIDEILSYFHENQHDYLRYYEYITGPY